MVAAVMCVDLCGIGVKNRVKEVNDTSRNITMEGDDLL